MIIKLKTKHSVDEVSDILSDKLLKNWKSQWNKNVYVGKINNNKFRYLYRKAYTRNSFSKEIQGVVYEQNGETYIEAKFINGIFSIKTFVYMWTIGAIFLFINSILSGGVDRILETFLIIMLIEVVCTLFILIPGIIIAVLPINKDNEEHLINFLKDNIEAEEFDG